MAGIGDFIKKAQDTITGAVKKSAADDASANAQDLTSINSINFKIDKNFYETQSDSVRNNWYKALPYGFRWRNRKGKEFYIMLPILPSNLNITTHYATNVVTTLYGTVEEHSEQRYFDIVIEGTTGMVPRYMNVMRKGELGKLSAKSAPGRLSYGDTTDGRLTISTDIAGGFFAKTIGTVNAALNKAADLISNRKEDDRSGVYIDRTGYLAFHRLYKIFLMYKADMVGLDPDDPTKEATSTARKRATGGGTAHPLLFLNYKDNCSYHCSIQRFTLNKTPDQPNMYQYSIRLRAYNLGKITELVGFIEDRRKQLGLDGVKSSSLLNDVKRVSDGAKQIIGAGLGGFNIFGR